METNLESLFPAPLVGVWLCSTGGAIDGYPVSDCGRQYIITSEDYPLHNAYSSLNSMLSLFGPPIQVLKPVTQTFK